MEIISTAYNNDELNKIINYADGFILMIKPYSVAYKDINLDEAIKLLKANNKKIILGINKIFHPFEIDEIKGFINKYKNDDIYYYISDLGIANILIDLGLNNKIIYNPETMITNYLDLSLLMTFNFDAYQMSSEITLNDLKLAYEKTNSNLAYFGFGKKIMFYSKRKLLSLYSNKTNIDMPKENGYLKETTRNDYIPITENINGTYILRPYAISLLEDIDSLSFLKYMILDSNYIDFNDYIKVLNTYYDYNNKKISLNMALDTINNLNLLIEDGFKNNDTVYLKEELKNV